MDELFQLIHSDVGKYCERCFLVVDKPRDGSSNIAVVSDRWLRTFGDIVFNTALAISQAGALRYPGGAF